jgi:hypothetical protein
MLLYPDLLKREFSWRFSTTGYHRDSALHYTVSANWNNLIIITNRSLLARFSKPSANFFSHSNSVKLHAPGGFSQRLHHFPFA